MSKAYWIAMIDVTNPEKFQEYVKNGPATLAEYGGKFLARNGKLEVFEGTAAKRIALIEFPSLDNARSFYQSAEYQKAKMFRDGAATCTFMAVEGLE